MLLFCIYIEYDFMIFIWIILLFTINRLIEVSKVVFFIFMMSFTHAVLTIQTFFVEFLLIFRILLASTRLMAMIIFSMLFWLFSMVIMLAGVLFTMMLLVFNAWFIYSIKSAWSVIIIRLRIVSLRSWLFRFTTSTLFLLRCLCYILYNELIATLVLMVLYFGFRWSYWSSMSHESIQFFITLNLQTISASFLRMLIIFMILTFLTSFSSYNGLIKLQIFANVWYWRSLT